MAGKILNRHTAVSGSVGAGSTVAVLLALIQLGIIDMSDLGPQGNAAISQRESIQKLEYQVEYLTNEVDEQKKSNEKLVEKIESLTITLERLSVTFENSIMFENRRR